MKKSPLLILSIETVSRAGSIAVLRDGEVLAEIEGDAAVSHSEFLLSGIKTALEQANVEPSQIGLLAAAKGPGSFTGLRIGLATVKGLSAAWKIPSAGVSILEAVASGVSGDLICTIFPAGRQEVFAQLFSVSANRELIPQNSVKNIKLGELLKENSVFSHLKWIAPDEFHPEIAGFLTNEDASGKNWELISMPVNLAVSVGLIALGQFQSERLEDITPVYVRGADIGKPK